MVKDGKSGPELLAVANSADKILRQAFEIDPDNVECLVLRKMIYQIEFYEKPQKYYQKGGAQALQALSLAEKRESRNPRVALLKAENLFFTPQDKDGNKEKGIDFYKKALNLFKSFKPKSPLHPNWGEDEAKEVLAKGAK